MYQMHMGALSECEVDIEPVRRRIRLAVAMEKTPDVISTAEGVLLLRRAGIHVFYELVEAVASMVWDGPDPDRTYRALMRIPEPQTVPPAPVVAESASNDTTPDPERRLARLRALGGSATYKRGEWKIIGITYLVESEKSEGRKRSDEKTIRADLKEAAQNELDARRAGFGAGLGQR